MGTFPGFIGGGTSSIDNAAQGAISDVHIFTPALVNEFRFGYVRHNGSIYGSGQDGAAFALQHNVALFPAPILGFPSIAFNYSGQLRALRNSRDGAAATRTSILKTAFNERIT
ncbi:MAG: hypothetical protein ACR2I2_18730 [Bryobacteraceae bacterium]